MSNDEGIREDQVTRRRPFVIWTLSSILPPGIGYRWKALAKFSLLSLRFHLLVRLACLLFGTWT
jgi:hypothetical protein